MVNPIIYINAHPGSYGLRWYIDPPELFDAILGAIVVETDVF